MTSSRHRDDDAANGKKATVLKNGSWDREVEWKDVAVGDIMEISDGDQVPADMVIPRPYVLFDSCRIHTSYSHCSISLKTSRFNTHLTAAVP